ncbi:MAG: hypothetical protein QOF82_980 [Frankiales bacterium]|nr:hypothetical protein [Frankiales bacterium]
MGIGISVFLLAVGAVLAFAVDAVVPNVDLVTVGVICMAAGALGLLMFLTIWGPRRRAVGPYAATDHTVVSERMATPTGERTVVRESTNGY